jgi:hypothetical protein
MTATAVSPAAAAPAKTIAIARPVSPTHLRMTSR